MKFGVVTFPGSNCDEDMIYVLESLLGQEVERLWHKEADLKGVDFVVLPGGFSYGDYLRSGAIAKLSPIMTEVIKHAENGGYVLGVCNGFQILTESGLLDGALLHNDNQKFICKNVYLKPESTTAGITKGLNPDRAKAIFTILMAAVIAISIKMVGLLLITGMLIIPAAMARNISDSPQKMVLFSVIGGLLSVILGLFSSLEFNTASGPSIIMAALVLFILSLLNIKQSIKLKN